MTEFETNRASRPDIGDMDVTLRLGGDPRWWQELGIFAADLNAGLTAAEAPIMSQTGNKANKAAQSQNAIKISPERIEGDQLVVTATPYEAADETAKTEKAEETDSTGDQPEGTADEEVPLEVIIHLGKSDTTDQSNRINQFKPHLDISGDKQATIPITEWGGCSINERVVAKAGAAAVLALALLGSESKVTKSGGSDTWQVQVSSDEWREAYKTFRSAFLPEATSAE